MFFNIRYITDIHTPSHPAHPSPIETPGERHLLKTNKNTPKTETKSP